MFKLAGKLIYYCTIAVVGSWLVALVLQVVWILPAWFFAWGTIIWIHKFAWFTITWGLWISKWGLFWWTPLFMWGVSAIGKSFWFVVWLVLEYWYMFLYVIHCIMASTFTALFMGPSNRNAFGICDWNEASNIADYMVLYLSNQKTTKLPEEVLSLEDRKKLIIRYYGSIAQGCLKIAACISIPMILQVLDWKIFPAFPYRVAGTFISTLIVVETIKCIFTSQDKYKTREHPNLNQPAINWRTDQAIYLLLISGVVLLEWVLIPPAGILSFKALKTLCF